MTLNVIFDMNGTMIDDSEAQFLSCAEFGRRYDKDISHEVFHKSMKGKPNAVLLKELFGDISEEEIAQKTHEKEEIYIRDYHPVPIEGLIPLLKELKENMIPCAIATSAPPMIVGHVMDNLKVVDYFDYIIDDTHVENGKPDPDIFLEAADRLGAKPEDCIVFEDSVNGISAAKSAGMKVIGLATSNTREHLVDCDLVIDDFTQVNLDKLKHLANPTDI